MSADHHSSRSSVYYKDSYGSSSKRYHSPSDSTRLGLSGSSSLSHYYESSEGRSKRSRVDTYGNGTGAHTSATSRYNDYNPSGASNSRYKATSPYYDSTGLKASSSDYRREDSYGRAGAASTSSKYLSSLEDSYGKLPGSSRSATKSVVRRIPPPLTPPISSSSSKSMMKSSIAASSSSSASNRLLPLMKVSVASNSGGGTGSSGGSKDYYGSRMRQAPPEHHYPYSSHGSGSSYKKEFRRPSGFPSFRYGASNFARPNTGYAGYSGSGATHGRNLAAIRKLTQRTAANVTSRIQRRATTSGISRSYDDSRRRHGVERKKVDPSKGSSKEKEIETEKEKVKDNDVETADEKEKAEGQVDSVADGEDGNEIIDEIRGDEDVDDKDGKDAHNESEAKTENAKVVDKDESLEVEGSEVTESDEVNTLTSPSDVKDGHKPEKSTSASEKEKEKSERRRSIRDGSPSNRTLLKLHCHYCDVRCISFREFSNHLRSYVHTRAMHGAVTDMRKKLSKLRNDQRDDQRKLEKSKSEKTLSDTTSYCRVCELNFRTDPKEHEANELHNKIKTLIYQRCDICNIDFRIWKVYLYHLAALEHAKRVAMKQLHEGEAKGENVKGTNLSQEELGLELVEQRTVFYCNACTRYLPIKGTLEETKSKHCMTLTHLKYVDEYRQREKQIALREKEKAAAKKLEEAASIENESEKAVDTTINKESTSGEGGENGSIEEKVENDVGNEKDAKKDGEGTEKMDVENAVAPPVVKTEINDSVVDETEPDEYLKNIADVDKGDKKGSEEIVDKGNSEARTEEKGSTESEGNQNVEEEDEDEIELHAGDEEEDLSMDDSGWSRRTRSSIRKNSSDRKSLE